MREHSLPGGHVSFFLTVKFLSFYILRAHSANYIIKNIGIVQRQRNIIEIAFRFLRIKNKLWVSPKVNPHRYIYIRAKMLKNNFTLLCKFSAVFTSLTCVLEMRNLRFWSFNRRQILEIPHWLLFRFSKRSCGKISGVIMHNVSSENATDNNFAIYGCVVRLCQSTHPNPHQLKRWCVCVCVCCSFAKSTTQHRECNGLCVFVFPTLKSRSPDVFTVRQFVYTNEINKCDMLCGGIYEEAKRKLFYWFFNAPLRVRQICTIVKLRLNIITRDYLTRIIIVYTYIYFN